MEDSEDSDYERCSYCGRRIFPGVAQCPYCRNFTDGQGPLGPEDQRRLPRLYVIVGWLVVIAFLLPLLWAAWNWLRR